MADTINSSGTSASSSAFAITPSDTVALPYKTRAIYVGVGGNLEKKFNETAAVQQKAQAELSKLIEEIKPKEGKWDLQDNLTWKKIEEPVPAEPDPKVE